MRPGLCHLPPQIAGQAAKSDVLEGRCVFIHLKKKKNLQKPLLLPSLFPSLYLFFFFFCIILSQREGRSHCWLCLRDFSAHPSGCWWEASDESTLKDNLNNWPYQFPRLFFPLLVAVEFVVCGIPAVLKFCRDLISALVGQKVKKKSCSYFKDRFPTWFLKLHVARFILQNIMYTRVRFDGWTMNSWPVSDSLSKCLAVHESHTSMRNRVGICVIVQHFLWWRSVWGHLRCSGRSQTAASGEMCL